MTSRAILIVPQFENERLIEELRRGRDPLFGKVPPHLTLVFPFHSELSPNALRAHVESMARGHAPFQLALQGIKASNKGYLSLLVSEGSDRIVRLHNDLYTGPLEEFRDERYSYRPHMTIGRTSDPEIVNAWREELSRFGERFQTTVGQIVIEKIAENEESIAESVVPLG